MASAFVAETEAVFAGREPEEDPRVARERLQTAAVPIIARITEMANNAVRERQPIEQRWIEDMCQYAGVRNVQELKGPTKANPLDNNNTAPSTTSSSVFVNITRPKTNRTEGRLFDILFPADDRNWGIKPTPVPELAIKQKAGMDHARKAITEANRLGSAPGEVTSPTGMTEDELVEQAGDLGAIAAEAAQLMDEAKQRCERMEAQIADQFVEGTYAAKSRDAISWACKIGIGVLKGPVLLDRGKRQWKQTENVYELDYGEASPAPEVVSPWSFFPDPSATSMDDAEFILQRHLPSKRELQRMARNLSFDKAAVRELLRAGPGETNTSDTGYLADIRLLTGETTKVTGRYIVWEFHGQLTVDEIAKLLRAPGTPEAEARAEAYIKDADPLDDRMVILYFCDNHLLKITEYYPMDSGDFMYSVFSLEKGQASILGAIGIPRMMRDSQMALNAAWRMMMDNAALSVGPQVLMDRKAVSPVPGDDWTMRPRKIWLWDSSNSTGQQPFTVFNVPMNQEQIAGIIALAKAFIDDETAMPSFIEGGNNAEQAPGAASTVGGFAMLLNAAGVNIRRMVKNWDDDVTTPTVRRFYDWNMQHSDRDEIKGDMCVEARGTTVLLAREMEAQNLGAMAVNWTVHPVLGSMIKSYDMVRKALQAMGINPDDVLVTRDEFKQMQDQAAQQAGEAQPEDPQWNMRLQIAQLQDAGDRYRVDRESEIQMMRLAEASDQSLAQIQADLEKVRIKAASDERKLAVEVATEENNARRAEASGLLPTGSGGSISAGGKRP